MKNLTILILMLFASTHFLMAQPAEFNFTPTNTSGTVVAVIEYEGSPASDADWVAAFDEDGNCAGATQLILNAGQAFCNLVVYGDDPTTTDVDEGINPGESFTLRLWVASTGEIIDNPLGGGTVTGWDAGLNGTPIPGYGFADGIMYNYESSLVSGCTDNTACNFNPEATADDNSCVFASGCDVCDGNGGLIDNPDEGESCDDGDACTVNDVIQADCSCAGTFADADADGTCDAEDICADAPEPGTACDDGDAATFNDVIQADCSCAGSAQDCEGVVGGTANEGTPCDDGDACTENDVYQADCSCAGTPIDADNDGAVCAEDCDDNDASIGAVGSACDDGDACTINDVLQDDCSCAGTFADADADGTCDAEDVCADGPEPGTSCDDGDAATSNDVIQDDCSCMGSLLDCAGVAGGSSTVDECGVCDDDPTNDNETCTDCAGVINGDAQVDECGVCEGTGIAEGTCDCEGTPEASWYADNDNDGLGDPDNSVMACEQPEGYVSNSDDLDDNFDDSFCEEPIISTSTECLENGNFTIMITVEQSGTAPTLFVLDNQGTIPSIVSSEENTFTFGEYTDNTIVDLSIATGANCDGYMATLTDDCFVEPVECELIAIPTIECNDSEGTYQVVVTVSGGSGNYAYSFAPSSNYEDLSGNTEAGFISGSYTDGETYYISVIDNTTDCEVILGNAVECTKTAIELLSFEARMLNAENLILWETATEIDNDYFNVMRSYDGVHFENVGVVNAEGNSSTPTSYELTDYDVKNGTTYYRLDAIDIFGVSTSSNIISLDRTSLENTDLTIMPNPAVDFVNVQFDLTIDQLLDLSIYDISGKLIVQNVVNGVLGNNSTTIDVSSFGSGLYYLQLSGSQLAKQATFIVD